MILPHFLSIFYIPKCILLATSYPSSVPFPKQIRQQVYLKLYESDLIKVSRCLPIYSTLRHKSAQLIFVSGMLMSP